MKGMLRICGIALGSILIGISISYIVFDIENFITLGNAIVFFVVGFYFILYGVTGRSSVIANKSKD